MLFSVGTVALNIESSRWHPRPAEGRSQAPWNQRSEDRGQRPVKPRQVSSGQWPVAQRRGQRPVKPGARGQGPVAQRLRAARVLLASGLWPLVLVLLATG